MMAIPGVSTVKLWWLSVGRECSMGSEARYPFVHQGPGRMGHTFGADRQLDYLQADSIMYSD